MLQINPAETFPICRQIANHLDTSTYYVRGVIKDAVNDTVLSTVDLDDKGSQYFRYNWKVVWDNTMARGRYITIVTSVYTDSGYTTKSENYGDEINTYVVQERWDAAKMQSMGGGSYNGITARDVRKVVSEEIKKIIFPEAKEIEFPKQKEFKTNFSDLSKELKSIKALVGTLPAQNSNLKPLIDRLDNLVDEIKIKPVTKETDIKPLLKVIKEAQIERAGNKKEVNNLLNILEKKLTAVTTEIIEKAVKKTIPKIIQSEVGSISFSVSPNSEQQEKKTNINRLKSKFGIK